MDLIPLLVTAVTASTEAHSQTAATVRDTVTTRVPDFATWTLWVWLGLWGAVGGVVSFYRKVKAGAARWLNLNELIGEIGTSAFVGVITGMLCTWASAPAALTFALVGITGHMGGRAIFWAEGALQRWAEKRLGLPPAALPPTQP